MRRIIITWMLTLVVACGSGTGGSSDEAAGDGGGKEELTALLTKAQSSVKGKGSFKMTMEMLTKSDLQGQVQSFGYKGTGEFDAANEIGRMVMTFDLPSGFGGAFNPKPCEMITTKQKVYFKTSGAKPWIAVDTSKFGSGQVGSQDPADFVEMLGGIGGLEEIGEEQIDGVKTTHYRGTLAADEMLKRSGASLPPEASAFANKSYPMDVWLDGDGLPRRIRMDLSTPPVTIENVVTFTDYGVKVDVSEPPADQVDAQGDAAKASSGCFGLPTGG